MGWREFRAWVRVLNRQLRQEHKQDTTEPDSWAGSEHDGWWEEQRRKRDRMRGRG